MVWGGRCVQRAAELMGAGQGRQELSNVHLGSLVSLRMEPGAVATQQRPPHLPASKEAAEGLWGEGAMWDHVTQRWS